MANIVKQEKFSQFVAKPTVVDLITNTVGAHRKNSFTTAIVAAVSENPVLGTCEPHSIISAALKGEALGFSPASQLGQYYIIPYGNKATFQMGYKGYYQLAMRSGKYKRINVSPVKQGELVSLNRITEQIELNPILDYNVWQAAQTIGYIGYFELVNGFMKMVYWTVEELQAHAQRYSVSYKRQQNSLWKTDFEAMAQKTVLKNLLSKWGLLSVELEKAIISDDEDDKFSVKNTEPEDLPEDNIEEIQEIHLTNFEEYDNK